MGLGEVFFGMVVGGRVEGDFEVYLGSSVRFGVGNMEFSRIRLRIRRVVIIELGGWGYNL